MLEEKLLALLEARGDNFTPAREIRKSLGISQVSLLKNFQHLRGLGYQLGFDPPAGYRLEERPDLLTSLEVKSGLRASVVGKETHFFKETGSTNDVAFSLALAGAREGTAVVAEFQRSGRGRLGRRWESPPTGNIYTSVILRPEISPRQATDFTLLAAVSVAQAIRRATGLCPTLIWPNDILLGGKKVGGILLEMYQTGGRLNFLVLGIGINVNGTEVDFSPSVREQATSLREEGGKVYRRVSLLRALYEDLERDYFLYREKGLCPLIEQWQRLSRIEGREVRVSLSEGSYSGLALGLDHKGGLVMRGKGGGLFSFPSGQVLKLELL